MIKSIGKTIKSLRKERNITQEELAMAINVTSQAISKWENETGLPDISQIIPLASFFNVTTDVLFGINNISNEKEVEEIIDNAFKEISSDDKKVIKRQYDIIQEGLKKYPTNLKLLMHSIELSISLAYKENTCFYEEYADEIYKEAIRESDLFLQYSNNINDILRVNMIMVILHSSFGNFEKAIKHANHFPYRPDLTINSMCAFINHEGQDFVQEKKNLQRTFSYLLQAITDTIARLGEAYENTGDFNNALKMYEDVFLVEKKIFKEDNYIPAFHVQENYDLYTSIARCYLKMNDSNKAIKVLKDMVDYDMNERYKFINEKNKKVINPYLSECNDLINYFMFRYQTNYKEVLLEKLQMNCFSDLFCIDEYKELIKMISNK